MPIYEYECSICNCRFDKRQSFSDEPVAICPKCNSKSNRVLVPAPVIFKGSGFYVTDYPSGGAKGSSSSGSSKSTRLGSELESQTCRQTQSSPKSS